MTKTNNHCRFFIFLPMNARRQKGLRHGVIRFQRDVILLGEQLQNGSDTQWIEFAEEKGRVEVAKGQSPDMFFISIIFLLQHESSYNDSRIYHEIFYVNLHIAVPFTTHASQMEHHKGMTGNL